MRRPDPPGGPHADDLGTPCLPPAIAEAIEHFCVGQSELRARLARIGDAVGIAPSGCNGVADDDGGHGDGQK
jgi:hypothetical protein